MPIRNKDGTIYSISKPNPIMKAQTFWDKFSLHNFNYVDSIIDKRKKEPEPQLNEEYVEPSRSIVETRVKSIAYCLPAVIHEVYDRLYDERRTEITYGKQFSLDVIVIDNSDVTSKLWIKGDINKGSVLFLAKDKRWWRVSNTEAYEDGLMLDCSPSDITPSFDLEQSPTDTRVLQ